MNEASNDKITYKDVEEYESLFTLAPPFLLERFAKKNSNLVLKFKSIIETFIKDLTKEQRAKLDIILDADTDELQNIMNEAYKRNNKKQYQILANPNYKEFIENNLNELRKMV